MSKNETDSPLSLTMSKEEANLVLQALAELPFKDVYGLIAKIQEQAQKQQKKPNVD